MCSLVGLVLLPSAGLAKSASVSASQMGETIHFEFQGLDQWPYSIDKKQEGGKTTFFLQVPAVTSQDLQAVKASMKEQGLLVSSRPGPDGSSVLEIQFDGDEIEHFDYLTDKPSRLIVDFFPKGGSSQKAKTARKINLPKVSDQLADTKIKNPALSSQKSPRKPANTDVLVIKNDPSEEASKGTALAQLDLTVPSGGQTGVFDGADPEFSRFEIKDYEIKESASLASRHNVYVDFPTLRQPPDELQILRKKMPVYQIEPKPTDENKQARLLLTLYNKKRLNIFLKTVQWFSEKYPNSEYNEIVKFMSGDVHFGIWSESKDPKDLDLAITKYKEALNQFPESKLAERTRLLIGFSLLERGDYLASIQEFQAFQRAHPASVNKDLSNLAIAEAFYNLGRSTEAIDHYNKVVEGTGRDQEKVRAQFLKGDVYFREKNDDLAISEYQKVIQKFPQESADYPGAYFNLAASFFRKQMLKESLKAHLDFVRKFPSHKFSGYAMTRVGELLEALGSEPGRVMGAFLETYFRYGETEGAIVARLRLLSARMKTMKDKELQKAVDDIMGLAEKSPLPKIDEFARLMISDGYFRRGDFDKANDLLIKYYQGHPTSANGPVISQRIVRNLNEQIYQSVEKNDFIGALKIHQKNSAIWLKGSPRIDLKYSLGRAFEQAGVFNEAEDLYRENLNKMVASRSPASESDWGDPERLPKVDELSLRLAAVSSAQGKYQAAFESLKEIENPANLSESQQVERIVLAASLYDRKGEPQTAIRYLTELVKAWKGMASKVAEPYLILGDMENKVGNKEAALKSYERVDQLMTDSGDVSSGVHSKALEKIADRYAELKKWPEAVAAYEKLLEKYENSFPLASVRYRMGKIHFDQGELKKAADAWKSLSQAKDVVWNKLAQENLKSAEWSDDYKKYLKRIPAMNQQRGTE